MAEMTMRFPSAFTGGEAVLTVRSWAAKLETEISTAPAAAARNTNWPDTFGDLAMDGTP
jgi:hypothetical protein